MNIIKKLIFNYRYKKAIRQARQLSDNDGRKYFVILFKGKPLAITKQRITQMVRTGKFRKGVTVAEIEKSALFITAPQKS